MLPNRNISYMTQDSRIAEIDLAGNIINHWYAKDRPDGKPIDAIPVDAQTFHHDVSLLPNGNRVVLEEPKSLPHHLPERAAAHIWAYLKKNYQF